MLDIIYTIFTTLIHSITTLLNMILTIPAYIGSFMNYFNFLPDDINIALGLATLASVIIALKRLIL